MKTKYILHGGHTYHPNSQNEFFFKEILEDTPEVTRVLLVYFAKEEDRVEINRREDVASFEKNKGGKNIIFEVAEGDRFIEQIH